MRSLIKINTAPVADAYSSRNEKRVEFSATRTDVQEDGSYNSLMGGLIGFRLVRKDQGCPPAEEDRLIVTVYRTDKNVDVHWNKPEEST